MISVILPVYNGEKFISDAINSILKQTHENFELIIVNDCSTDSTLEIISEFALQDSRIKIITNPINKKLPASLNIGHQNASGDYITWTSDDNLYKPNAFEECLHHLQNSNSHIVYTDFDLINDNGTVLKRRTLSEPEYLVNGNCVGASFLYKREVYETLKGYNEDLFLVEDYDFWLRALITFKFKYVPESLYFYRSHGDSLSSQIGNNEKKNNLWKENLTRMYDGFLSNFTNKHEFFSSLFTKQLTHQPILLSELLQNKKDFVSLVQNIVRNDLLNKGNIKKVLKEKLLQLLISNPQKGSTFKFSIFIVINFWRQLKKNDIKTLIKYNFFK
ncbi:glycosyltransferase family 2 protein [Flavobacterium sp.]|uniref:glycosyltransferase family 2 protein n=1 Tax=Flavobacterium sp. TaxID=239 RepID=UPI0040485AD1